MHNIVPRHIKKDKLPSISMIQTNKHVDKSIAELRRKSSYFEGCRDTVHTSMQKAADSLLERSIMTSYIEKEKRRVLMMPGGPQTEYDRYLQLVKLP